MEVGRYVNSSFHHSDQNLVTDKHLALIFN